jgi:hypothetical protein
MATDAERALGRFVRNYPTDNGRRGKVALLALIIGLAGTAAGIPLTIAVFDDGGGSSQAAGLALGVGLVGLWAGITSGLRTLRRHGEIFQLREGGLLYRRTGETRMIRWEDIRKINDRGQNNAVSRAAGWNVHCVLRVTDGRSLLITGFTEDAAELAHAVQRAVHNQDYPPPSAPRPDRPATGPALLVRAPRQRAAAGGRRPARLLGGLRQPPGQTRPGGARRPRLRLPPGLAPAALPRALPACPLRPARLRPEHPARG